MTPKRRMVRKISQILPSKNFKGVFQNSLLTVQEKKTTTISLYNNNYNPKVLNEFNTKFSHIGLMKSPNE